MSIIIAKPSGISFTKSKIEGEVLFNDIVSLSYVYAKNGQLYHEKFKRFSNCLWNKLAILKSYNALIYIREDTVFEKDNLGLKKSDWCPLFVNKKTAVVAAGERSTRTFDSDILKTFITKNLKPIIKNVPNFFIY